MRYALLACLLLTACAGKDPAGTVTGTGAADSILLPDTYTNGDTPPLRLKGGTYTANIRVANVDNTECTGTATLHPYGKADALKQTPIGFGVPSAVWTGIPAGLYTLSLTPGAVPCAFRVILSHPLD